MVASRGPVPKRSSQRRRRNKPAEGEEITEIVGAADVPVPEADAGWHPIARRFWDSFSASAQAEFYQPTDWAVAYLLSENVDRLLADKFVGLDEGRPVFVKTALAGGDLSAVLKGAGDLLMTEGGRRRHRVEIEKAAKPEEEASVSWLDHARHPSSG